MTVKIKVKDKLENDTLDLSCCDLEDVPVREIATVKKGTHLDLSNNQLVRLPGTFMTLSHIVKLDLSKNLLEELPENIGELRQLKHLDLYSNKISRLPLSFAELKNLKWLDLKDNPLTHVLALLAGPCGDNAQCQNCALIVVSYYNTMKESIAAQKELAMKAAAAEERKREAKRRRKRKRNAEKNNMNIVDEKDEKEVCEFEPIVFYDDIPEASSHRESDDNDALEDIPDGLSGASCRHRTMSLMIWLSLRAIIFILMFTIFSKIDKERSDMMVRYVESKLGLPIENYQRGCVQKLDSIVYYLGYLMNHVRILIRDTYQRHFGEELVDF